MNIVYDNLECLYIFLYMGNYEFYFENGLVVLYVYWEEVLVKKVFLFLSLSIVGFLFLEKKV